MRQICRGRVIVGSRRGREQGDVEVVDENPVNLVLISIFVCIVSNHFNEPSFSFTRSRF